MAIIAVLTSLAAGCLQRVPVIFHVTDADTRLPISDAHVRAVTTTQTYSQDAFMTFTGQTGYAVGQTDENGRVELNVPSGALPIHVHVGASGYMQGSVPGFTAHWARKRSEGIERRYVSLYPLPVGRQVLVVPDGFRGPLFVVATGLSPYSRGQRIFEYPAHVEGITRVPSFYPVTRGGSSVSYRLEARFVGNAEPMPRQRHFALGSVPKQTIDPDQVALRLVAANGAHSIFIVGTADDAGAFQEQHKLHPENPASFISLDRLFPEAQSSTNNQQD